MVGLNILLILLSFINSINKKVAKADVAHIDVGEIVLSGGPDGPGDC